MDENLDRRVFVAFDIETTGLQPIMNRTLELSAVKFTTSGRILGEFDELINPGIPIPEAASKVNKIYEEDIRNKSRATEILKGFSEFLDGCGSEVILLAHNSEFDVGFLGAEYILCNMEPPKVEIWDTLPMSRALVPNIMNHKLSTLVHHFD
ncbi:3'-5' exonuclease, partial [bacterium]|nr:3'-5' exonuclease [bacterium]